MKVDHDAMTMLVCIVAFGAICYALLSCGSVLQEYNEAYALGTEVKTTDEYELLFNDSFEGRIVYREGLFADNIHVRTPDGVQRAFAARWLEAGGD